VELAEIKFGRRRMLLVRVNDGSGQLTLRFFHFSRQQQESFRRHARLRCFGEARSGATTLEMVHPEYQLLTEGDSVPAEASLTPIYPTTEGVHQLTLRGLTEQALQRLAQEPDLLPDWLPEAVRRRLRLPPLPEAVHWAHRPPPGTDLDLLEQREHPCQQRLVFEELLAHHLSLKRLRQRNQTHRAPALCGDGALRQRFLGRLDFSLTAAQRRVADELDRDLRQDRPMLRLVQGDVGSGKTVVAALAALQALEAGCQAVLMAPTELLAEQHYASFAAWLEPLGVRLCWLSGKMKTSQRRAGLAELAAGQAQLAVGTHALFQGDVIFPRLGLVIIDEQHRFGVHQRLALRNKGQQGDNRYPHQLTLTATPIPRTLAMSVYADLDTSVIDELPPGRSPVTTVVMSDSRRPEIVERVAHAGATGRQVYWVCTLIEESEVLQCQAAEDSAKALAEALPQLRVGLVHGRLKAAEKEQIMQAFKAGKLDLLVATTVIEVGVDVPNASLMIIENAERLGLAQLHQLRGRVGRGTVQSSCVLLYQGRLSQQARERLAVMRETNDGFVIAQRDLEIRGPGEVLGTRQTGMLNLRLADLLRDEALLPDVAEAGRLISEHYPERVGPLVRRWLGQAERFGQV